MDLANSELHILGWSGITRKNVHDEGFQAVVYYTLLTVKTLRG